MRAATITIPHDDSTLELAVSTLPLGDDWIASCSRTSIAGWISWIKRP